MLFRSQNQRKEQRSERNAFSWKAPVKKYEAPKNFGMAKKETLLYGIGDRVCHMKFGEGTVTQIVEGGRDYEVTVDFDCAGVKKMFATFAKLKKVCP